MNAHVVATKINVSWMAELITPIIAYRLKFVSMQYRVFPICMPTMPDEKAIELAKRVSQDRVKNAVTYLLFLWQATARKTSSREVKGRATGYKTLTRRM